MRIFLILLSLCTIIPLQANDLPTGDAVTLENELDNICGDSWCEGNYNWAFNNLTCHFKKATCSIDLTLIDTIFRDEDDDRFKEYYNRKDHHYAQKMRSLAEVSIGMYDGELTIEHEETCVMSGFNSLEDVSEGSSYSDKLYESVSDCISAMEEKFYALTDQADILSSIAMCSLFNLDAIEVNYSSFDYNHRRHYYDEEVELAKLLSFAKRMTSRDFNRVANLRYLQRWNQDDFYCSYALNSLYREWNILIRTDGWSSKKVNLAARFTSRNRYRQEQSINIILSKDKE